MTPVFLKGSLLIRVPILGTLYWTEEAVDILTHCRGVLQLAFSFNSGIRYADYKCYSDEM